MGREVPLPNRVDPFGKIHAVPDRGTLFGNRGGCIHTPEQTLHGRPWTNERWICCLLEYKGWRRKLMQPGLYTELFFLDEATAFAAGHRPCMLCRRADAKRFIAAWEVANLPPNTHIRSIFEIDRRAHSERIDPKSHAQRTSRALLSVLPDGALLALDAEPSAALLLWRDALRPWSFAGYGPPRRVPLDQKVALLTPASFAAAFSKGYTPSVHPSATEAQPES